MEHTSFDEYDNIFNTLFDLINDSKTKRVRQELIDLRD